MCVAKSRPVSRLTKLASCRRLVMMAATDVVDFSQYERITTLGRILYGQDVVAGMRAARPAVFAHHPVNVGLGHRVGRPRKHLCFLNLGWWGCSEHLSHSHRLEQPGAPMRVPLLANPVHQHSHSYVIVFLVAIYRWW